MKIVVLSMVPQRDLVIDNLIAGELRKRGHDAVVRLYTQDGREAIIAEKPDVCVTPVVRCEYTRDFVTRLKQWGIKVIARRSEAGVSKKQFEKLSETWKLDQTGRYDYKDLIDRELVWSQEFADVLISRGKITQDKVRIIGGITTDIYFLCDVTKELESQRKMDKQKFCESHKFDPHKKTLFFTTGFVCADLVGHVLPEARVGDPIHDELVNRDKAYRAKWISTIKLLAQIDKYNILVRPHHGEIVSEYKLPENVCVSNSGSAADALIHCDVLIHAGSTMAVEAHILNKPAFNFGNTAQDELIRDVSPAVETTESLIEVLGNVEYGKSNALILTLEDLKKHFYGEIDGKAHIRCADAVCEFDIPDRTLPVIPSVWPEEELKDYSSDGVVKVLNHTITWCPSCKKPFQNLTKQKRVPCPHCGISVDVNPGVCKR